MLNYSKTNSIGTIKEKNGNYNKNDSIFDIEWGEKKINKYLKQIKITNNV